MALDRGLKFPAAGGRRVCIAREENSAAAFSTDYGPKTNLPAQRESVAQSPCLFLR